MSIRYRDYTHLYYRLESAIELPVLKKLEKKKLEK